MVVDTLDEERTETEDGDRKTGGGRQQDVIWAEAEWRLGFVIRNADEDEEDGEEPSWMDPTCMAPP